MKCASSKILDFGHGFSSWASVKSIYEEGKGVCTEFNRVFDDLAGKLGIPSRTKYSHAHAYNKVKIDGEWYYTDPQDSSCTFFYADSPTGLGQKYQGTSRKSTIDTNFSYKEYETPADNTRVDIVLPVRVIGQ